MKGLLRLTQDRLSTQVVANILILAYNNMMIDGSEGSRLECSLTDVPDQVIPYIFTNIFYRVFSDYPWCQLEQRTKLYQHKKLLPGW